MAKDLYVSNRDISLTSTTGHALKFKKGEPLYVPPAMRKECIAIGILPQDEKDMPDLGPPAEPGAEDPAPVGLERDELLEYALTEIREKNDPNDFTAGGLPRLEIVEKALGFQVTASERSQAWLRVLSQ